MTTGRVQALVCAALAAAAAVTALTLLPFDSDGALAIHDPVYYGMGAERDPLGWILPHHPLFHALAAALTPPLRALGSAHPGHLSVRIISGLGAVWLLLQIVAMAGKDRALAGGGFALVLFATRGFLFETAAGETVIPAAAAAVFALRLATKPDPRPFAVGAALLLAVLLRLDNVLIVPGIVLGLLSGSPRGTRVSRIVAVLLGAGLLSLLAYVGAWMIGNNNPIPFDRWLLPAGLTPWMGAPGLTWHRFGLYATGIVIATAGQGSRFGALEPWTGLGVLAAIAAAGVLLRGTTPDRRMLAPALVTLAARALFHTWFEADNFEWLMFPIALVAAASAGIARGAPATGPAARCGAALVLAGLVAWMLGSHLPTTWQGRGRVYMGLVEEAAGLRRAGVRFLAQGETPGTALALLDVPFEKIGEVPGRPDQTIDLIAAELGAHPVETVVILSDRFVINGQPYMVSKRERWRLSFDDLPETLTAADGLAVRLFRRDGLTLAARFTPAPRTSRPATR